MAKYIDVELTEQTYRLEYTRDALVRMEREGFSFTAVGEKPVMSLRLLVWGALLKHDPRLTVQKADTILDEMLEIYALEDLFSALLELVESVMPKLDNGGKKPKKAVKVVGT